MPYDHGHIKADFLVASASQDERRNPHLHGMKMAIPGSELLFLPTGRTGVNKSLKSGWQAYHIVS